MNEFRRLAAKMYQHMQQLCAQGVNKAHAIINRMLGYVPDLHKIWVGTSDDQIVALSNEFPGFYHYALIMEEASEAERQKVSRPYDGLAQFTEQHKQLVVNWWQRRQRFSVAIRRFLEVATCKSLSLKSTRCTSCIGYGFPIWKALKSSLRAQSTEPRVLEYLNGEFGRLTVRIKKLAG